jgi:fused signal recognition particle receptor
MFKLLKEKLLGWRQKAAQEIAPGDVVGEKGRKVREGKLEDVLVDLEIALLEADVAHPVAQEILKNMKEDLLGKRIAREVSFEEGVELALRRAVEKVLAADRIDFLEFVKKTEKPVIVMFVGVNGTGKTTAIAKVANLLQKNGYGVVIAAADTFRAGAIEQIEIHADRLGTKLIKHKAGGDPAAVAFDAVEHARARRKDVVLIDTAGRMQTNQNLMDQMKKIQRVAKPHMVVFVGDALAGNDAVEQARTFHEAVGFDAAILCKIDADAKGGAALSIAHAVGKPILFVGTGQTYDDLQPFDPHWMVEKIFGEA